jgi:hypothetical protein
VKDRRWDVDERGHDVADARGLAPGVHELVEALTIEDWVAEEPEAHLLPHIERACRDAGLELLGHFVEDAVFVVRIAWPGGAGAGDARAAAFSLVGSFAESATSVRQRGFSFEVVTGMLDPDTPFKSRGYLVGLELVTPE